MPSTAIVGGGFSGAMVALHLQRLDAQGVHRVVVVEPRDALGLGQAYSTQDPRHLLNIRAGSMSPLSERPDAFTEFLARHADELPEDPLPLAQRFVPRQFYGRFINGLLAAAQAEAGDRLAHLQGQAVGLRREAHGEVLSLADGRALEVDHVVLALGNLPPGLPFPADPALPASPCYVADPWAGRSFDAVDPDATVLLVGTGLTMVDCVVSLAGRGHRGPILALSRHGLLPRPHGGDTPWPAFVDAAQPQAVRRLLHVVREQIRSAESAGADWRAVLNTLRPISQTLWSGLPDSEQARFIRHLRPWWDVHRHRIAPVNHALLERLQAEGRLVVMAGRILHAALEDGRVRIRLAGRRDGRRVDRWVDRVVNCSGPNYDFARAGQVLLAALAAEGRIRINRHRLGIDSTPSSALLDAAGRPSDTLFGMGPMLRGQRWEINGVPEIVRQAEGLARLLLAA